MNQEISDAQHNHDERSALRRNHAEDIQSIAKALGIDDDKVQTHELIAHIQTLRQERDQLRDALACERRQNHEQIVWRARDQTQLAQILGFDPENPKHTIPFMMGVVRRAVEDARSWRQAQRKR